MQQKHILLLVPTILFIALGSYLFWKNREMPTHYFNANVSQLSRDNTSYRKILYTTEKTQLTLMSIPVGDEIPKETHPVDQIFVIVDGTAQGLIDGTKVDLSEQSLLIIPAGTEHTISNAGTTDLKIYTVYAPPQHPVDTIHLTKEDGTKH